MTTVATTFRPHQTGSAAGLTVLPYLTDREADGILDALCDGHLRAVADDGGAIVAVMEPDRAEHYARQSPDAVKSMHAELKTALRELASLRTIIGEVMAESRPQDFDYRLIDAAEDAQRALDAAIDASEEL